MGLENKFYFVRPYYESIKQELPSGSYYYSRIYAEIDMAKMGYSPEVEEFRNVFSKECDFSLLIPDESTESLKNMIENSCGEHLCYAEIKELIPYVENIIRNSTDKDYWLFSVLLGMLKAFEPYEDILVVNYSY